MTARGEAAVQLSRLLLLHLLVLALLHVLQPAAARHGSAASAVASEKRAAPAAMDVPRGHSVHARDLSDPKDTSVSQDDGPRRRQQWDFVGPSLLLGGTLAALMLAAIGHLASKALLASMLSAALSAVQLARPPPPNRPG
ncbi:uncharacterized protein LOC117647065 [Thrips palmi]|uniref:Uncharacterized protein LOC117647065 n=1 Tax=Thrips palmi TaxID=161013 RepID=A0A6P8Z3Y2_THRPL|nr:uncharacterized protein LOC117647065 [Thrips palmi]